MSFLQGIIPEKPVQRAVSVTALAIAGCGGLYFAAESGGLVSWSLPYVKPWQVLTLTSWAINTAAVSAGGRLDGPEPEDPKDAKLPLVRYFMPAGWAFSIWGPIFLGEAALAVYQTLPLEGVSAAAGWLSKLSPWLSSAFLVQSCWCLSFREWARDSGLLWFPAALLGGTAACLGGAHHVVRGALAADEMSNLQYGLVHLPVSLHFGWVSCATLVNLNNYISLLPFSDKGKLNFSLASIASAVGLAVAVTGTTGDPVYAGVVAWALSAVASDKGWAKMKGKVENSTLETQALVAKIGAAVCAGTAIATPLLLKQLKG
ncbi:unnamed protein product [Ectocarpus sp. 6 AP-2014]